MALRNGMPLLQVSKLLGHEQIDTTQIYLDISDQELMQAHEKFVGQTNGNRPSGAKMKGADDGADNI